ncbi:hypothetical protein HQ576_13140 [bacterium]|nr:hypothetical protein [bacterium]
MVIAIAAAEVVMALLTAWVLVSTQVARHASSRSVLTATDGFILGSMLSCLALFIFVLACWQWRLSPAARSRLLVCVFVSLAWSFGGLCWYDVSVQSVALTARGMRPPAMQQLTERTVAAAMSMAALALGLAAVTTILFFDRRAKNSHQRKGNDD